MVSDTQNTETPTPVHPTLNSTHYYYLHPGENPGAILVSPPLHGDNYQAWSRSMKRALLAKNKYKFIDGTLPSPKPTDDLYEAWERCNNIVVSWIHRTLSPDIAQSTVYIDNALSLWLDLQDRFSRGNHFRVSNLLQDLHSLRQGERNVSQFFTDLKTSWEELDTLRPTPRCTCSRPK